MPPSLAGQGFRWQWWLLGLLCVGVLVRVVSLGLATEYAVTDPARALSFRAGQPLALRESAAEQLAAGEDAKALALARAALRADPLDGTPYRLLARLALRREDRAEARRFMTIALRHSPQDSEARAWLAADALARRDGADAIALYDRLLRVSPEETDAVFAVLNKLLSVPPARAAMVTTLAGDPPWRRAFLDYTARAGADLAAVDALFSALRRVSPLTRTETTAWVNRLVAERRWPEAFLVWVNSLSATEQETLATPVNGDFEWPSAAPPFDWVIESPEGIEAGIRPVPGEAGHALEVEFYGRRSPFHHVRQLLQLAPGAYQMHWRYRLDHLATARGLRWAIDCAGETTTRILNSDTMKGDADWTRAIVSFDVPKGCAAQWLSLELEARIPSETQAYGAAWFDDVKVVQRPDEGLSVESLHGRRSH